MSEYTIESDGELTISNHRSNDVCLIICKYTDFPEFNTPVQELILENRVKDLAECLNLVDVSQIKYMRYVGADTINPQEVYEAFRGYCPEKLDISHKIISKDLIIIRNLFDNGYLPRCLSLPIKHVKLFQGVYGVEELTLKVGPREEIKNIEFIVHSFAELNTIKIVSNHERLYKYMSLFYRIYSEYGKTARVLLCGYGDKMYCEIDNDKVTLYDPAVFDIEALQGLLEFKGNIEIKGTTSINLNECVANVVLNECPFLLAIERITMMHFFPHIHEKELEEFDKSIIKACTNLREYVIADREAINVIDIFPYLNGITLILTGGGTMESEIILKLANACVGEICLRYYPRVFKGFCSVFNMPEYILNKSLHTVTLELDDICCDLEEGFCYTPDRSWGRLRNIYDVIISILEFLEAFHLHSGRTVKIIHKRCDFSLERREILEKYDKDIIRIATQVCECGNIIFEESDKKEENMPTKNNGGIVIIDVFVVLKHLLTD